MADVNGTASGETLKGFDTDDRIYAKGGDDTLFGGLGNDLLDGMTGADTMYGGAGNDRYRVDDAADVVDEDVDDNGDDGGIELIESTISYALGDYLENLTLIGSGSVDGAGNGLANKLTGNSAANFLSGGDGADTLSGGEGDDRLSGGAGKDALAGGAGSDTFMFGRAEAASTDKISDFTSADHIGIDAADYGLSEGHGLINRALDPSYFSIVSSGTQGTVSGHGQFVYNSSARSLMWDADGAASASAGVALTTFSADVSSFLTAARFVVTDSAPPPPPLPVVSVAAGSPDPQMEGVDAKIRFTLSLDRAASQDVVVSYSTVDATATTATDFFGVTNGSIVFAAGETSKFVDVLLKDDALAESPESFSFILNSASNAALGRTTATGNIADNDPSGSGPPVVSVAPGSPNPQTEGVDAKIRFTVSLDHAASQDVVVTYSTVDGTATAAADYVEVTNGSLTFAAGETSKTIDVLLKDDALAENPETFALNLISASNASLGAITAAGNIADNDPSGGGEFKTVSYNQGAGYSGLVDTFIRQANPTTSYGAVTRLEVDGGAGVTIQTLLAFNDLFGAGAGQIPYGATVTSASLTLQSSNASAQGGSLHRVTTDWNGQSTWASLVDGIGIGTDAVATADLVTGPVAVGARSFDVTQSLQAWAGGSPNKGWVFNPAGTDGWDFSSSEGSMKPALSVTYWTGAGPPPEPPPVVTISAGTPNPQMEAAGAPITFQVTLSKASSSVVTVNYATSDGSAKDGSDYFATLGTLTFQPGDTSKDIVVTLANDSTVESAESFNIMLSAPTNASLGTSAAALGNIRDDDSSGVQWQVANPVLVRATDTRIGQGHNIGAVDPAGIAWVPAQGSMPGRLFVSDSEVDESPYNSAYNLFMLNLDGSPQGSPFKFDLRGFTLEPTGLAYSPLNQMLYISDDDAYRVFWVDPANPTHKVGDLDVRRAGATDPEDIAIDPATGNIFVANGTPSHKITEITPNGDYVREYLIPSVVQDMEALAYDAQHQVFLVGGGFSSSIWVIDKAGVIIDTIDLSAYRNPVSDTKVHVKDIAFAPTSAATDDPSLMNLYVADYGETHTSKANDGRILEIDLGWNVIA